MPKDSETILDADKAVAIKPGEAIKEEVAFPDVVSFKEGELLTTGSAAKVQLDKELDSAVPDTARDTLGRLSLDHAAYLQERARLDEAERQLKLNQTASEAISRIRSARGYEYVRVRRYEEVPGKIKIESSTNTSRWLRDTDFDVEEVFDDNGEPMPKDPQAQIDQLRRNNRLSEVHIREKTIKITGVPGFEGNYHHNRTINFVNNGEPDSDVNKWAIDGEEYRLDQHFGSTAKLDTDSRTPIELNQTLPTIDSILSALPAVNETTYSGIEPASLE